jgi:SET family sugar efflux transporter-like MFS transporter
MAVASINFAQLFAYVREDLGRGEQGAADAPFMMGVLRAFYALAWTIGPLIGGRIVTRFGYLAIFLAAAALFVVFALCVFVFVAERAPEPSLRPNQPLTWGLGQPSVLAHCVAFGLMFAAFTLNTLNLPLFLTQKLGATEQGVGTAFAVSPLFEMAFMVWFGHVAARGHQRRVIVCGVAAATCYFLILRFVTEAWHVYPMQILNAAAVAVTTSVVIPYFQDLLPRQAGVATSLYSNALKVGGLVGFSAFGLLAIELGNTGLFLLCAGLSATTLVIVAFTRARPR